MEQNTTKVKTMSKAEYKRQAAINKKVIEEMMERVMRCGGLRRK